MLTSLDDLKLGQNRSVRSRGVVNTQGAIRFRLSQQKIRMSLFAISQGTSSAVAAVAVESVAARGQDRGATRKRSLGVPAPRGPSRGDGALRWWRGALRWRCPEGCVP